MQGDGQSKAQRRAAAQAAAAARLQAAERRRKIRYASAVVAAVVLVLGLIVGIALLNRSSRAPAAASSVASANVVAKVTGIPASTFDQVGSGKVLARPTPIHAPALSDHGKPLVVYVGAEYCPYCAAERWAVVAALSRFGTFTDLGATTSSSTDVYASTHTLSFHGATYSSPYLTLSATEIQSNQPAGNGYAALDSLSTRDNTIINTYDSPPYVSSNGAIPFIDMGGAFVVSGASYDPAVLTNGSPLTWDQIADQLADPTSPVAQAVDGTADVLSADLCALTHERPTAVCTSQGVVAAR